MSQIRSSPTPHNQGHSEKIIFFFKNVSNASKNHIRPKLDITRHRPESGLLRTARNRWVVVQDGGGPGAV